MPMPLRAAGAVPLVGFYALYFGAVGVLLPFLPPYLRSLGLSGAEIGALLAIQPALSLAAPPFWGWLADRFGRPDRVLSILAVGAGLGFAPLVAARSFGTVALALAAYAFFASSITSVLDSLALQRVALHGGAYARLRLFGSLGFIASAALFGAAIDVVDRRAVIVPLALIAAYAAWSFTLRARAPGFGGRHPLSGLGLLRHRDLALVLAATCLHWIASAPFHGMFGIHVARLGLPPWVVGASSAIGVLAEVAVMYAYPRVAARVAPRHVLLAAFLVSAARWAGMAVVSSPAALVALSVLHGMSFGAFYVAAVGLVAVRVPEAMRASGQALLVSITFGVGGLVGYLLAGAAFDALGGHRLFAVAAGLDLVPAALMLATRRPGSDRTSPAWPRRS